VTVAAGASTVEPRIDSGAGFVANVTNVPNRGPGTPGFSPASDVTLTWATWSGAAKEAGRSQIWGGIHFNVDVADALKAGRRVGSIAYKRINGFFKGTRFAAV
jgi:hypothetical protein